MESAQKLKKEQQAMHTAAKESADLMLEMQVLDREKQGKYAYLTTGQYICTQIDRYE